MNYKPHIRKCEAYSVLELYHCSLQRNDVAYWHEYGYTWRDALDKMEARVAKHAGAHSHGPEPTEQRI